jgi:hypothetical protein
MITPDIAGKIDDVTQEVRAKATLLFINALTSAISDLVTDKMNLVSCIGYELDAEQTAWAQQVGREAADMAVQLIVDNLPPRIVPMIAEADPLNIVPNYDKIYDSVMNDIEQLRKVMVV